MASPDRLSLLFERYLRRECTPEEVTELVLLLQDAAAVEALSPAMEALWNRMRDHEQQYPVDWQQMYETVTYTTTAGIGITTATRRKWRWRLAAAVLVLGVAVGSYLLFFSRKQTPAIVAQPPVKEYKNDAAPGRHQAILTLGNGDTVVLDQVQNGVVAQQGATSIRKVDSSLLAYDTYNETPVSGNTYNILTTPLGGTFHVKLPDGSQVWLNAGSSIRYPVPFTGAQREVTLTGEAYFEIVHNAAMPFRVLSAAVLTEDLGTTFNIMAYDDEPALKTTLLEGSVLVHSQQQKALLEPGQQAITSREKGQQLSVQSVDTDDVVAWKNGEFSFSHNSIYEIMRQVARWYKVEVSFEGAHDAYLSGNISKSVHLSEVLRMLELAGEVKFKIQDNKVTVIKL